MAAENLAEARASIIDRILTEGLKSAELLQQEGYPYLGSDDDNPTRRLYVIKLGGGSFVSDSDREWNFKHGLTRFYIGHNSAMQVLLERRQRDNPAISPLLSLDQFKRVMSRRAHSSLLVIMKEQDIGVMFEETPETLTQLSPEKFTDIIVPQAIWMEYLRVKHKRSLKNRPYQLHQVGGSVTKVVLVSLKTLNLLELASDKFPGGFTRSSINIPVPDYETVLRGIVVDKRRAVGVHGVRLPLEEDLPLLTVSGPIDIAAA